MAKLLDIFAFLSVLLRGLALAFEALLIGGIGFQLLLARCAPHQDRDRLFDPTAQAMRRAAIALAIAESAFVCANCLILMDTVSLTLRDVLGAAFAQAGLAIVASCLVLYFYLKKAGRSLVIQAVSTLIVTLALVATSHAWSRLENRGQAAGFALVHHIAAGLWIGMLPYLWIALRRASDAGALASIVRGFSRMAVAGAGAVVLAGGVLAFLYMDSLSALYGTSYGVMIAAKVCLLAAILAIGAVNFFIVRRLDGSPVSGLQQVRRLIEAEIGIGFTVILVAASLTSQPPAIDLPVGRVTLDDIVQRFSPRLPRLRTPPLSALSPSSEQVLRVEAEGKGVPSSYVPGMPLLQPSTPGDIAWSEYNHHWAGLMVAAMGVLAVASRTGKVRWARHWPLMLLGLAVFLFFRADPENWPLGPNGFLESFLSADVLQHRFFTVLIIGFAVFEWRVQNGRSSAPWMSNVLPACCALGGAMLLTHSHALSNVKEATLIELSHIPLAIFAVFAGWSRWLELRMQPQDRKVLSWIWPLCFVVIGSALLLYREG